MDRPARRCAAPGSSGSFHAASLEHTAALTHRALGDLETAAAAMDRSNRARPTHERTHRAVFSGILAEMLLDLGRLDEACQAWTTLLDEHANVRCGRADSAVALMRARLRPHARIPATAALLQRSGTGSQGRTANGP
ncbi:tol-pal system YbgF family protein [Embleya sp. NPDC059237]|uniref:tetratricopeptide repeat protein n=1 Tax=Embleya sp. NPDC059237 TaxID=3346784 RepID=UPI0036CCE55A